MLGVANKMLTVLVNLLIWDEHAGLSGVLWLTVCLAGAAPCVTRDTRAPRRAARLPRSPYIYGQHIYPALSLRPRASLPRAGRRGRTGSRAHGPPLRRATQWAVCASAAGHAHAMRPALATARRQQQRPLPPPRTSCMRRAALRPPRASCMPRAACTQARRPTSRRRCGRSPRRRWRRWPSSTRPPAAPTAANAAGVATRHHHHGRPRRAKAAVQSPRSQRGVTVKAD